MYLVIGIIKKGYKFLQIKSFIFMYYIKSWEQIQGLSYPRKSGVSLKSLTLYEIKPEIRIENP